MSTRPSLSKNISVVLTGLICVDNYLFVNNLNYNDGKVECAKTMEDHGGLILPMAIFLASNKVNVHIKGYWGRDKDGQEIEKILHSHGITFEVKYFDKTPRNIVLSENNSSRRLIIKDKITNNIIRHKYSYIHHKNSTFFVFDRYSARSFDEFCKFKKDYQKSIIDTSAVINKTTRQMFTKSDYPVVPEKYILSLTDDLQEGLKKLSKIKKTFWVTLAERGCVKIDCGKAHFFNSYKVKSKDTVGAGDIFRAAFLFGLLNKWPEKNTMQYANAAGALQTTKIGNCAAIPSHNSITNLINVYAQ